MKKYIFLIAILFLVFSNALQSADDDIVWMKKGLEYYGGTLYNNDQMIVTYTGTSTHFHYTETGEQFYTLPNANTIYFFDNDTKFYQISNDRKNVVVYNTGDFKILDSINHDKNSFSVQYLISTQLNNLVEIFSDKIRVWDILLKKVVKEIAFKKDEFQTDNKIEYARFGCNNELILTQEKTFKPDLSDESTWYYLLNTTAYNLVNKLDSLRNIGGGRRPNISKTCKYLAMIRADLKNGIDIYDFNTFQKLYTIQCNGKIISSVNFTSDDKYLVIGIGPDVNNLIIWDLINKKIVSEKPESSWRVLDITKDDKFSFCSLGSIFLKLRLNYNPNGVEEISSSTLFPNPTSGRLEIKYSVKLPNSFQYEIISLTGQTIVKNNLGFRVNGDNSELIDVSKLPFGRYNLRLYSQTENYNFKFIKGE